jgi:hypothetical protein
MPFRRKNWCGCLQVSVEWINIQLSTNSGEATGNQFHGEKL